MSRGLGTEGFANEGHEVVVGLRRPQGLEKTGVTKPERAPQLPLAVGKRPELTGTSVGDQRGSERRKRETRPVEVALSLGTSPQAGSLPGAIGVGALLAGRGPRRVSRGSPRRLGADPPTGAGRRGPRGERIGPTVEKPPETLGRSVTEEHAYDVAGSRIEGGVGVHQISRPGDERTGVHDPGPKLRA